MQHGRRHGVNGSDPIEFPPFPPVVIPALPYVRMDCGTLIPNATFASPDFTNVVVPSSTNDVTGTTQTFSGDGGFVGTNFHVNTGGGAPGALSILREGVYLIEVAFDCEGRADGDYPDSWNWLVATLGGTAAYVQQGISFKAAGVGGGHGGNATTTVVLPLIPAAAFPRAIPISCFQNSGVNWTVAQGTVIYVQVVRLGDYL